MPCHYVPLSYVETKSGMWSQGRSHCKPWSFQVILIKLFNFYEAQDILIFKVSMAIYFLGLLKLLNENNKDNHKTKKIYRILALISFQFSFHPSTSLYLSTSHPWQKHSNSTNFIHCFAGKDFAYGTQYQSSSSPTV